MSPNTATATATANTSILLQAIANPSLKSAASVLLRTMEHTGTISRDDADVLSRFMSGCGHLGGAVGGGAAGGGGDVPGAEGGGGGGGAGAGGAHPPSEAGPAQDQGRRQRQRQQQPAAETTAGGMGELGGESSSRMTARAKRPRADDHGTGDGRGNSNHRQLPNGNNGDDRVGAIIAACDDANDDGRAIGGGDFEPLHVMVGNSGNKRLYLGAAAAASGAVDADDVEDGLGGGGDGPRGSGLEKGQRQTAMATATATAPLQLPEDNWDPIPFEKPRSNVSASGPGGGGNYSSQQQQPPPRQQDKPIRIVQSTVQSVGDGYGAGSSACSVGGRGIVTGCANGYDSFSPLNTEPIADRESHTADLATYDRFIDMLREAERPPSIGQFSRPFWTHIRSILGTAVPVGFDALPNPDAVSSKGPKDCAAFLGKIVATSPINPIHPNLMAEASKLPLSTVLNELFCATKLGLVDMRWAPLCARCGSMTCAKSTLSELPNDSYCGGCMYDNTVDCLDKIKVIFTLNRDVFYVLMENFACTPSKASMAATCMFAVVPATPTGSGFRYSVGCGGELMFCPSLEPGRYRMHCPVAKTDNYLFVRREVTDDDGPCQLKLSVSDMVAKPGDQLKTFYAPHGMIHFDIYPDTRSLLVLWVQKDLDDHTLKYLPPEERPAFTNAKEIIEFPTFVLLFQNEIESMLLAAMTQMRQQDGSSGVVEVVEEKEGERRN